MIDLSLNHQDTWFPPTGSSAVHPAALCLFSSYCQPTTGILQRLPSQKAARIASIRRKHSRDSVLTAYSLLETAVSAFPSPPPLSSLIWAQNGRPSFQGRPELYFSLSHSPGAAACIAASYPVGIDVERLDQPLRDFRELSRLMGFLDAASPLRFLALWTMWESYLKYSGGCPSPHSLRLLPEGSVYLLEENSKILPAEFRLYRPVPTVLTAVCMPRGSLPPSFSQSPQTICEELLLL